MFPECKHSYPRWRGNQCIFRNYLFVLAIENTLMEPGYITEKLWGVFGTGAIPVYWGAPDVAAYVPEHSFIDVRDFSSAKALAAYLIRVQSDPALYRSYFSWTFKPLPASWHLAMAQRMSPDVFCRICEAVQQKRHSRGQK